VTKRGERINFLRQAYSKIMVKITYKPITTLTSFNAIPNHTLVAPQSPRIPSKTASPLHVVPFSCGGCCSSHSMSRSWSPASPAPHTVDVPSGHWENVTRTEIIKMTC